MQRYIKKSDILQKVGKIDILTYVNTLSQLCGLPGGREKKPGTCGGVPGLWKSAEADQRM